jgi:hypothetical protein
MVFDEMTSWLPYQTTPEDRECICDARLLNHVNVYNLGESEKSFTLYCDPLFTVNKQMEGRYSMIQYKGETDGLIHVGLIVALFLYGAGESVDNVDYYLTAVVARVCISDKEDNLIFPLPRYKFEKGRDRRFVLDQIQLKNLIKPLFYVSHGVKNVQVNCNFVNADNRFIILGEDEVSCNQRLDYKHYIDSNRLLPSRNNKSSLLGLKMFLSIDEILQLKVDLKVDEKCKSKQLDNIVPLHDDILVHNSDLESDSELSHSTNSSIFIEEVSENDL